MSSFTISAGPGTDIWRKPPHTDIFNAPFSSSSGAASTSSSGPLNGFISATASFSFPWKEQYDQAGLLLTFHPNSSAQSSPSPSPPKWIKTGIEYYNGSPMLSTVACERYADWSVAPLTTSSTWMTISIEKSRDEHGISLWVYQIPENGERIALREIAWVYGDNPEDWTLEVAAMAARPAKGTSELLVVEVKDLDIKWAS